MPNHDKAEELAQIAGLLASRSSGVAIVGLLAACKTAGLDLDRRTLLRRLNALVQSQRARTIGRGRATRYVPIEIDSVKAPATASSEPYVPLSPQGEETRAQVRRPVHERTPVGYNRAFLENYEPNHSAYLSETIRAKLRAMGRTPVQVHAAGTYARDVLNRLLIDLSWASSRLEGNTYSRLDTQNLIEFGHAAEGKDQREAQMILNHKAAIEMLVRDAEDIGYDTYTFYNLHALLAENLLSDDAASGRVRTMVVEISGSVFRPLAGPQQIEEYFRLILAKTAAIKDPFEQAFFLMVHIPYLQPFLDVNKRVSRLAANIPLIKHNLSPLSFVDVPERAYLEAALGIYELNRVELLRDVFVWAYERSCQHYVAIKESLPDPDPLRLRHREALISVVGDMVRGGKAIDTQTIRALAAPLVSPAERNAFVTMAFNDLHRLHEGNLARYRLRLSEYRAWKSV